MILTMPFLWKIHCFHCFLCLIPMMEYPLQCIPIPELLRTLFCCNGIDFSGIPDKSSISWLHSLPKRNNQMKDRKIHFVELLDWLLPVPFLRASPYTTDGGQ